MNTARCSRGKLKCLILCYLAVLFASRADTHDDVKIINGRPLKLHPEKRELISKLVPDRDRGRAHVIIVYKHFDSKCSVLLLDGGAEERDIVQFSASGGSAGDWRKQVRIDKRKSVVIRDFFESYVKFSEQAAVVASADQDLGTDAFLYVSCKNLWVEVIPATTGTRNHRAVQIINDLFKFAFDDQFGEFTIGLEIIESYAKESKVSLSKSLELNEGLDFHVWLANEVRFDRVFHRVELPQKLSAILEKR